MDRIRFGAVALGVAADKVTFLILATGLSAILSAGSSAFAVVVLLLGTACTTLGAYVAAARARADFLMHGLLVAVVGFVLSFARYLTFALNPPPDPGAIHPLWWELVGWSLLFAAGALGGSLARNVAASPS